MSAAAELLAECDAHGIWLLPAGEDGLTIDGPKDALTPALMTRLKACKAELLKALRPAIELSDATEVGQAALDGTDGGLLFEPGVMKIHRVADVRWASHNAATETVDDCQPEFVGPDGWPVDSIGPDELDPCPKCETLELWQTLKGNWRCQRCDPPTTARRLAAQRGQR